jgi:8-oxo-dGTP diphosphatase
MLLKRLKEPNKGKYTPVGGKLDPFESPLSAAIRETGEETGIRVSNMKFCGLLTETSPVKYNWINYVYLAEIEHLTPPFCNDGDLAWIHFDDVLKVDTPKTDWFIYKYILEGRPFAFNAIFDREIKLIKMTEELEDVMVFLLA